MATEKRSDIQGIRALAVALVVVFHLNAAALPGGYIGVDVFFVISGFLITAHLVREVERTGTLSLSQFWARRARRLLPVAFLVLIVSAIAAFLILPRSLLPQNLTEIGWAGLYVLNWILAGSSVDYLAADNVPSVAQHYWSLSVEEQFYLVWPLLVLLAVVVLRRMPRMTLRSALLWTFGAVWVGSFVLSVVYTAQSPEAAYFHTGTRAWEFASGALLALVPSLAAERERTRLAVSWGALAVLAGAAFLMNSETPFPGWVALIPVAATAALLWVGPSAVRASPQRLAEIRPVQFLGDTSYSIYLWHWPVIVLVTQSLGRSLQLWEALAVAAVTVGLAALSYRFVEQPLRRGPGPLGRRRFTFGAVVVLMAAVLAMTFVPTSAITQQDDEARAEARVLASDLSGCFGVNAIVNDCADPYQVTETVNASVTKTDSFGARGPASTDACERRERDDRFEISCTLSTPANPTQRVALIGDSHTDQFAGMWSEVGAARDWEITSTTRAACSGFGSPESRCVEWADEAYAQLTADDDIDVVVIAIRSTLYETPEERAGAGDRIRALMDAGKQVVVVRTTPGMPPDETGPSCVERAGDEPDPCAWQPDDLTQWNWLVDAAESEGATVFDTWQALCSADGTCHTVVGGSIAYFDANHLSETFARSMRGWFDSQIDQSWPEGP